MLALVVVVEILNSKHARLVGAWPREAGGPVCRKGGAVPDSWNAEVYRQRVAAWRQKAALLPEGQEEAAFCLEIAEGYAKLATALEAKSIGAREGREPAIMKAGHVMELVRGNSVLSRLVLRLRESGLSWPQVKAAIETEINRCAKR